MLGGGGRYEDLCRSIGLSPGDGGTVIITTETTIDDVARSMDLLPLDVAGVDEHVLDDDWSLYRLVDVEGGVLAVEYTGYADPPNSALRALSRGGRVAAVVRSNSQGHSRFGYARDGALVFEADRYNVIEDRAEVPADIRALFDLTWDDLSQERAERADATATGLALAEFVPGLRITSADVARLSGDDSAAIRAGRLLRYYDAP